MIKPFNMIFFEPQTGLVKDHPWDSNFYQHRLRRSLETWVLDNVDRATVGSGGLEYPPGFLEEVGEAEAEADQTIRNACAKFSDFHEMVPRRQGGVLF
jgi:hypothetical protein